jgi:hypothetical protein
VAELRPIGQAERAAAGWAERRAWVRYPTDLESLCQPRPAQPGEDCWWPAKVRDLSCGGVGLVLRHRFDRGTMLSVELPSTNQSQFFLLLAAVVHTTPQADGEWLIGCEFATPLSADDLRSLLEVRRADPGR